MPSISKTMRLSDEVVKLIEAEPGENFTVKFENLVYRAFEEIPNQEKRLEGLKITISYESGRLERIRTIATKLENQVNNLHFFLSRVSGELNRTVTALEDLQKDCKTS